MYRSGQYLLRYEVSKRWFQTFFDTIFRDFLRESKYSFLDPKNNHSDFLLRKIVSILATQSQKLTWYWQRGGIKNFWIMDDTQGKIIHIIPFKVIAIYNPYSYHHFSELSRKIYQKVSSKNFAMIFGNFIFQQILT